MLTTFILVLQIAIILFLLFNLQQKEKYDYFGGGVITGGETVGQALEEVPGFGDYSNWENE